MTAYVSANAICQLANRFIARLARAQLDSLRVERFVATFATIILF